MIQELDKIIAEAKILARRYYEISGRPLGITGEVAEYEAIKKLNLVIAPPRETGFDATRVVDSSLQKIQIKGRCVLNSKKSQRLGSIKLGNPWDLVIVVLLNKYFEPMEMFEADRSTVIAAIMAPGSKARSERGTLTVSKFKSIGKMIWKHQT